MGLDVYQENIILMHLVLEFHQSRIKTRYDSGGILHGLSGLERSLVILVHKSQVAKTLPGVTSHPCRSNCRDPFGEGASRQDLSHTLPEEVPGTVPTFGSSSPRVHHCYGITGGRPP